MRYQILLLALLCGCRREARAPVLVEVPAVAVPPAPPQFAPQSWSTISVGAGVVAEVRQTATARDRCHVSGALAGTKVWSLDACLASFEDLRFVSPDGVALVVLQTAPDAEQATVGAVFRKGARIATLTPASLHLRAYAMHIEGGKLHWLASGEQRETPDGVEVQLLDGSSTLIRFDARSSEPEALWIVWPRLAIAPTGEKREGRKPKKAMARRGLNRAAAPAPSDIRMDWSHCVARYPANLGLRARQRQQCD